MSELIHAQRGQSNFRWHLLASVSAAALVASAYASGRALAEDDADRPTVWIELGGQLDRMDDQQQQFAPPYVVNIPNTFFSPVNFQKPLQSSFGVDGAISFEPEGSDWVLSVSVRFGRSNGFKHGHQQTPNAAVPVHSNIPFPPPFQNKYAVHTGYSFYPKGHVKFDDAKTQQSETHSILDFQVGKDVGLGMFGNGASSTFSAGVRFAQFTSKSNISLRAEPDVHYPTAPITNFTELRAFKYYNPVRFHDFAGTESNQRSFRGVGPSVAWNGSKPFVGSPERGEISIDWGANAAVLFGRQKVRGHHQTTKRSYYGTHFSKHCPCRAGFESGYFAPASLEGYSPPYTHQSRNGADFNRVRTVVVPNLGGMAGLSFRYSNAKVSFGYRADFFFGAMDGGIDVAHRENRGFYGPFASISVGIGG
jgi:iron complex outermembrane recepter protein